MPPPEGKVSDQGEQHERRAIDRENPRDPHGGRAVFHFRAAQDDAAEERGISGGEDSHRDEAMGKPVENGTVSTELRQFPKFIPPRSQAAESRKFVNRKPDVLQADIPQPHPTRAAREGEQIVDAKSCAPDESHGDRQRPAGGPGPALAPRQP